MDDPSDTATTVSVDPRLVNYTQLIYGLHAASLVIALLGSRMLAAGFVFGMPSIIAVIMNYARRDAVRGTWLESHFRWQTATFWRALLALIVVSLLFWPLALILIGIPLLWLGYGLTGLWAAYRVIRGWVALNDGRTLPTGGLL